MNCSSVGLFSNASSIPYASLTRACVATRLLIRAGAKAAAVERQATTRARMNCMGDWVREAMD